MHTQILRSSNHRLPLMVGAAVLILMLGFVTSQSASAGVPKFLYNLSYPGNEAQVIDPGNIYFDPRQEEVFVTDTRDWRMLIFDKRGRYTYDFRDPEHLACTQQVAVDSMGRIYTLRVLRESVISVFEYNGEYLRDLELLDPVTKNPLHPKGMALDGQDRLYILTDAPAHVYCVTTGGDPLSDFAILTQDKDASHDFGTIAIVNGKILIPLPIDGMVARYTTDGKEVTTLGAPGDGEDEFSLPIAAAGDKDGNIYVLDKHKHSILVFDDSGKWRRVEGGRGMSPGWFYHPTCLAVTGRGQAVIGQTYMGRVQSVAWEQPEPNANVFTQAPTDKK